MIENQQTVNAWQRETFGFCPPGAAFRKFQEEVEELRQAFVGLYETDDPKALPAVIKELADVQIVLWQIAGAMQQDMQQAVDAVMIQNRARTWNLRGDGTGQHE